MDGVVKMSAEDRRLACVQAEERLGLQAASIEKDFWVCWTLRELAGLPDLGQHLTFKGGTSLSKAWKLIDRFSEDIDLVVDRDTLGFGGAASPERAPNNAQRKRRLGALIEACRSWVQDRLRRALARRQAEKVLHRPPTARGSGPGRATKWCVKSSSTASASWMPRFSITTKLRQSTMLYFWSECRLKYSNAAR
jgi:hypothetical protein